MRKRNGTTDYGRGSGAMSRRGFLKSTALLAAGASFPANNALAAPRSGNILPGRIAIEENLEATSGSTINLNAVKDMVDHGLMTLSGETNAVAALESLFTGLDATKRIAIKVNCLEPNVPTRWEVVKGLTDRMGQMLGGAFSPGNITIFDCPDNGSHLSQCGFTAANFPGLVITNDHDPDPNTQIWLGDMFVNLSSHIVNADYVVNCPVIKGHYEPFYWTVGFKNHIGSIAPVNPGSCHPYEPRVLTLNSSPHLKNKTYLLVLSALHGMYAGGPWGVPEGWSLFPEENTPNTVMLSTDPVTFERWGIRLIDEERAARGMTIYDHTYCQNAASVYDLGIYDLAQHEVLTSLSPPASLTASVTGATNVLLQWPVVVGAATYRVYRSTSPYFKPDPWGGSNLLGETAGISYTDSGAAGNPDLTYYYIVRAYRACWESADSQSVGVFGYAT